MKDNEFMILAYHGSALIKLNASGYQSGEKYTGDVWVAAKKLFDKGLNVMVKRTGDGEVWLCVDTLGFKQR